MRRIALLSPLAVVLLGPMLAGCDDAASPTAARETVALGPLPPAPATTTPEPPPPSTRSPAAADGSATSATAPSSTDEVAEDAPTRLVEVLAGLVEGEIPSEVPTSTLRDETGRLRVAVPQAWSDRRTEPAVLAGGSETPSLGAAPDLTSFLDGYDAPGLTAVVVAEGPAAALEAYAFDEDCLNHRRGPYRDAGLEGRYEVWESCGGTLNDIVTIAVRPEGAQESVLLLVQLVGPEDLVALDAAVASLDLRT